jgi:hypothetical protein
MQCQFRQDAPAVVPTGSKQLDTLIISLLVARVHSAADQQHPGAFVHVDPVNLADFIPTHGREIAKRMIRPTG